MCRIHDADFAVFQFLLAFMSVQETTSSYIRIHLYVCIYTHICMYVYMYIYIYSICSRITKWHCIFYGHMILEAPDMHMYMTVVGGLHVSQYVRRQATVSR
jgi:hypothetical protein